MTNHHAIDVEVLGTIKNGYRLKVSVTNLGLYSFGWTARHSDRSTGGIWVQPPAVKTSAGWKKHLEFDKTNQFWLEIEKACIEAVNSVDSGNSISDDDLTDEAIKKAILRA